MRRIFVAFFLITSFVTQAQSRLNELLSTTRTNESSIVKAQQGLESFIQSLLVSEMPDHKTLQITFNRMHTTFFRKYEAYADFNAIFETGSYDCLTATALFSIVLERLNFNYEIVETNYHIFIIVQTSKGEVLLETTDRLGGLVKGKNAIGKRTGDYRSNQLDSSDSEKKFEYSFKLYQSISPQHLTGLLYFNQAVKAFNNRSWINCARLLEMSYTLYDSPRCHEMGSLLARTIIEIDPDQQTKEVCLAHLKNLWIKRSQSVAIY